MIDLTCGNCGKKYRVDEQYAGRKTVCKGCGSALTIPTAPTDSPAADDGTIDLAQTATAPPRFGAAAPAPGFPAGSPPPLPEVKSSGMATAAMVLGILGLVTMCIGVGFLLGLLALILGLMALKQIDAAGGQMSGRGPARAGAIMGGATLAMLPVMAVLIGILVPALGAAKKAANKMKDGTQVRAVVNNMTLWSASQTTTDDFPRKGVGNCTGNTTLERFNALCNINTGDPLSPRLLVNPAGMDIVYQGATPVSLSATNLSYAMLDVRSPGWRNLTNAGAPLVCDKQVGAGSAWSAARWEGNVGWGDVRVTFSTNSTVRTMIGGQLIPQDDLFQGNPKTDAVMVNP
jgi:hypothetical protein